MFGGQVRRDLVGAKSAGQKFRNVNVKIVKQPHFIYYSFPGLLAIIFAGTEQIVFMYLSFLSLFILFCIGSKYNRYLDKKIDVRLRRREEKRKRGFRKSVR